MPHRDQQRRRSMVKLSRDFARQLQAARALLELSEAEVARKVGVPAELVSQVETSSDFLDAALISPILAFYPKQGVTFVSEHDGTAGVMLAGKTGIILRPRPSAANDV